MANGWPTTGEPIDETTLIYKKGDDIMDGKLTTKGLAVLNGSGDPFYIESLETSPMQARFVVKENGYIGAGIDEPVSALHIRRYSDQANVIIQSPVDPSLKFISGTGYGEILYDEADQRLKILSNGVELVSFNGTVLNMEGDSESPVVINLSNKDDGGARLILNKGGGGPEDFIPKISLRHISVPDSGHIVAEAGVPLFITAEQGSPDSSIKFRTSTWDESLSTTEGDVGIDSTGLLVANKGLVVSDSFSLLGFATDITGAKLETLCLGPNSVADSLHTHNTSAIDNTVAGTVIQGFQRIDTGSSKEDNHSCVATAGILYRMSGNSKYLYCNGAQYDSLRFPNLASTIGTRFGTIDDNSDHVYIRINGSISGTFVIGEAVSQAVSGASGLVIDVGVGYLGIRRNNTTPFNNTNVVSGTSATLSSPSVSYISNILPDLRGYFLRGAAEDWNVTGSEGGATDPYADRKNGFEENRGAGIAEGGLGQNQHSAFKNVTAGTSDTGNDTPVHTHTITSHSSTGDGDDILRNQTGAASPLELDIISDPTTSHHHPMGAITGGSDEETRPVNVGINYFIKG